MDTYRCQITYKPQNGSQRVVIEHFQAKNIVDAKARASNMYANTIRVHACITHS